MNDDVPTFGTAALITALVDTGALEAGTAQGWLRQLREAYVVDLPLDGDWMKPLSGIR